MATYPFVSTPAQATAVATAQVKQVLLDALTTAVIAQLSGQAQGLSISPASLTTTINTLVQGVATDTQQPVTHPITGQPVQPAAQVQPVQQAKTGA